MATDIAQAKRKDRKLMPDLEVRSRTVLQRLVERTPDARAMGNAQRKIDVNFREVNAKWMKIVRAKYEGVVIRRGITSVDNKGELISGLEPYVETICLLNLYDHEYDALEQLAVDALDKKSVARRFSSEVGKERHRWNYKLTFPRISICKYDDVYCTHASQTSVAIQRRICRRTMNFTQRPVRARLKRS